MHQMPMPGVFVTILVVGFAWLVFAGISNLLAMRFPHNPVSDAILDVYGSGSD
jgi:hypothetical protein